MNPYIELLKEHAISILNIAIYIITFFNTVAFVGSIILPQHLSNHIEHFDTIVLNNTGNNYTITYIFTLNKTGNYTLFLDYYKSVDDVFPRTACKISESYQTTPDIDVKARVLYYKRDPSDVRVDIYKKKEGIQNVSLTFFYTCKKHVSVFKMDEIAEHVKAHNCEWEKGSGDVIFFCPHKTQEYENVVSIMRATDSWMPIPIKDPITFAQNIYIILIILPTLLVFITAFKKGMGGRIEFTRAALKCNDTQTAYTLIKDYVINAPRVKGLDKQVLKLLRKQTDEKTIIKILETWKKDMKRAEKRRKRRDETGLLFIIAIGVWAIIGFPSLFIMILSFIIDVSHVIKIGEYLPFIIPIYKILIPCAKTLFLLSLFIGWVILVLIIYESFLKSVASIPFIENFFGDSLGDLVPNEYKLAVLWTCVRYKVFKR